MKGKLLWIAAIFLAVGALAVFVYLKFFVRYTELIPLAAQYEDTLFWENNGSLVTVTDAGYTGCSMLFDHQPCEISEVSVRFVKSGSHELYFLGENMDVRKKVTVNGSKTVRTGSDIRGLVFSVPDEELGSVSVRIRTKDRAESNVNAPAVSIIGDSLSAYEWTIPAGYKAYYPCADVSLGDMWWSIAAKELGFRVLINNSCGGSGVSVLTADGLTAEQAAGNGRGKKLSLLGEKPEQIWVLIGGNDIIQNAEYLTIDRSYRTMVDDIRSTYPDAEVTLVSYYLDKLLKEEEFVWLASEIETIAKDCGCRYISLTDCGISRENAADTLFDYDSAAGYGIHPNKAGMQLVAEDFIKQFKGDTK